MGNCGLCYESSHCAETSVAFLRHFVLFSAICLVNLLILLVVLLSVLFLSGLILPFA
jgi:hypothetical protein